MIISKDLPWVRQPFVYARNGTLPSGQWRRTLIAAANHLKKYQRKELFASSGQLTSIPAAAGAGARQRWRFRAPTGYGAQAFVLTGLMAKTPTVGGGPAYTEIKAVPVGGGTTLTKRIYYGNVASGVTVDDSLDELGEFSITTDRCVENQTYEFEVADYENARIAQLTVYELAESLVTPPLFAPYLDDSYAAVGAPILDTHRALLLQYLTEMWNRNAAVVFQFAAEQDSAAAPELASATETNILDETSTTVTPSTPGWQHDMTYKRSKTNTVVKAEFAVYAKTTVGSGGVVKLKNSAGTLATISGINTAPAWFSTSADVPATADKLDVHMSTSTGTIRVLSAGLYLYV